MQAWLATSLVRHFPSTPQQEPRGLTLHAALRERVSFQVAFRSGEKDLKVSAAVSVREPLSAQIRQVGYVPMPHRNTGVPDDEVDGKGRIPGYVPDPLFPSPTVHAGPHETHAFWVTVKVPYETVQGECPVSVRLTPEGEEPVQLIATIVVHRGLVEPRRDFPVTHWFYADGLCDWYHVEPFEERFWPILDNYLADVSAHGLDVIHTPLFTPPTDGVKRPNQLLDVRRNGDRYQFEWSLVRRWVQMARENGLTQFEWPHLFTQWGAKYAVRIYEGHGGSEQSLWDPQTPGDSPAYRDFLRQFLPALKRFLEEEGLMEASLFHLSDEPHGEEHLATYRKAREMLRELAPWMKVMDALSEISFAREGLTDTPIPLITTAPQFIAEGYPAWTYFWGGPRGRYAQRELDTPLIKTRMLGWIFYRTKVRGFLHWGYNYWYKSQTRQLIDPYAVSDGEWWPNWAYGDTFQVYPGEGGPVDSLRWEVFADSLQDYALLQSADIDPDDPLLAEIVDYADFPKSEQWLAEARAEVLARLDRR
jgi:hypothetical protein